MTYLCPRCTADPKPEGFTTPRQCGFTAEGQFTPDNWNCATLDALIGPSSITPTVAPDGATFVAGSDERCEVTPTWIDDDSDDYGGFIVTTRYKRRGRTDSAIYVGMFHPPKPVTLALIERVIQSRASHEVWRRKLWGEADGS